MYDLQYRKAKVDFNKFVLKSENIEFV